MDVLKEVFAALNAAGIPLRVGNKRTSKAEQHLMDALGFKLWEARDVVRRLKNLGSRI